MRAGFDFTCGYYTGISQHKRQTENKHGWTTFFTGLDTHWTKILIYSEDRVKWRQLVHGVTKPRNEVG